MLEWEHANVVQTARMVVVWHMPYDDHVAVNITSTALSGALCERGADVAECCPGIKGNNQSINYLVLLCSVVLSQVLCSVIAHI